MWKRPEWNQELPARAEDLGLCFTTYPGTVRPTVFCYLFSYIRLADQWSISVTTRRSGTLNPGPKCAHTRLLSARGVQTTLIDKPAFTLELGFECIVEVRGYEYLSSWPGTQIDIQHHLPVSSSSSRERVEFVMRK